jgi:hypothetical protein
MAHTIQLYRDRISVFDDIDLLIIMSMIIETIKDPNNHNIYACLEESAADWEWVIEAYGPGIIELGLDQKIREQTVRDAFLSVLRDVKTKLESFGEWVPLEFLNGLVMFSLLALPSEDPRIVISLAQPACDLLKVVREIEELIGA